MMINKIKVFLFFTGILLFNSCTKESPKAVPQSVVNYEKIDFDSGIEVFDPKVDILFVIDDSGSMDAHQKNLIDNIYLFIDKFTRRTDIDYHIGVLTSTMEESSWSNSLACCGALVRVSGFSVITTNTPSIIHSLSLNLKVGTGGAGEEAFFSPVMYALNQPLVSSQNRDFLRPEAHLAIVFITDAEDQSKMVYPQEFYDFLLRLKGHPEKILTFGVIVPTDSVLKCDRDSLGQTPLKIEEFLNISNQGYPNVYNLCDPRFGENLAKMSDLIVQSIGNMIYLKSIPLLKTVVVSFGTQIIPPGVDNGWSYNPEKNAIRLGSEIQWTEQPVGTKLKVDYQAAKINHKK